MTLLEWLEDPIDIEEADEFFKPYKEHEAETEYDGALKLMEAQGLLELSNAVE